MRLFQHHPEQLAEHLPRPHGIGVRQRRALHRRRPNMIKPRLMALHAVHDLAQARRATELAIQQRDQLPLRGQLANQPVRPVLLHNPVKPRPRNVLRQTVEYAILMPHGVDFLPCPERVRSAQNTEESTSCTLSTKIQPDSSGLDPAIHPLRRTLAKVMDTRVKPAYDERRVERRAKPNRKSANVRKEPSRQ